MFRVCSLLNNDDSSSDNSSSECAVQIKRFVKLTGTNLNEWETSELKSNTVSIDPQGRKYYEFSDKDTKDYREIQPFFDYLEQNNPTRLQKIKAEHDTNRGSDDKTNGSWWYSCQYCGHGIIYPFKIKNIGKKLKLIIGSHCVKRFQNVDPFMELIKKRNYDTLKTSLKRWKLPIIKDIWKNEKFVKIHYRRDGEDKTIPKQKYINFAKKLKELDVDKLSFDEIKKIFREADKLKLSLPVFVLEIIHPTLTKKHKQNNSL